MRVYCKNWEIFVAGVFTTGKYYSFNSAGLLVGNNHYVSDINLARVKGIFSNSFRLVSEWDDI